MEENKEKIGIQKHIRIVDGDILAQIERVMELPEYKSFNQVVNDALFYGLPILGDKLFGVTVLPQEELPPSERTINSLEDKHFQTMIKLLKETVINVTINKSILSSLFHGKCLEYKGDSVDAENFESGVISDTPDYLYDYELRGLRSLRR